MHLSLGRGVLIFQWSCLPFYFYYWKTHVVHPLLALQGSLNPPYLVSQVVRVQMCAHAQCVYCAVFSYCFYIYHFVYNKGSS